MTSVPSPSCERTRGLLSRRLDGPVSELERRAVVAHTARCAACRAFEVESRWFTEALRRAPLEALPKPVVVTTRGRLRLPVRAIANAASAAAVIAVAIGGLAIAPDFAGEPRVGSRLTPAPSIQDSGLDDPVVREFRREALRNGDLQVVPVPPPSPSVKPLLPTDTI